MDLKTVKAVAFVSCPLDLLVSHYLGLVTKERLQPEIGLNGDVLDRFRAPSLRRLRRHLDDAGLDCTVHAPFTDLTLGAIDRGVRRASLDRLLRALDAAAILKAKTVVCHTGFDPRHHRGWEDRWRAFAVDSVRALVDRAEALDLHLALENVFEAGPEVHSHLLAAVDSPRLGFCLDFGHQEVFSQTSLSGWLDALGPWVRHLHLHDNRGIHDEHLALGQGILDFEALFRYLRRLDVTPRITLEAHKEEDVMPSLETLGRLMAASRWPMP